MLEYVEDSCNSKERKMPLKARLISEDQDMMHQKRRVRQSTMVKPTEIGLLTRKRIQNQKPMNDVSNQGVKWLNPDEVTKVFNDAIRQDIARKQERGLPVARYNKKSKRAYLENADGTKEYV